MKIIKKIEAKKSIKLKKQSKSKSSPIEGNQYKIAIQVDTLAEQLKQQVISTIPIKENQDAYRLFCNNKLLSFVLKGNIATLTFKEFKLIYKNNNFIFKKC